MKTPPPCDKTIRAGIYVILIMAILLSVALVAFFKKPKVAPKTEESPKAEVAQVTTDPVVAVAVPEQGGGLHLDFELDLTTLATNVVPRGAAGVNETTN